MQEEKQSIEMKVYSQFNRYTLETTANFRDLSASYTYIDQQVDRYASESYFIVPVAAGILRVLLRREGNANALLAIGNGALLVDAAALLAALAPVATLFISTALTAVFMVWSAHKSYQFYRYDSNEALEHISMLHGQVSRVFYCQDGWGESSFFYNHNGRYVDMQLTCKKDDYLNITILLHSMCDEIKRITEVQKKLYPKIIEINTAHYDNDSQNVSYNGVTLSCKGQPQDSSNTVSNSTNSSQTHQMNPPEGTSPKNNKSGDEDTRPIVAPPAPECDAYFQSNKCKKEFATNPIGSPAYKQNGGTITIVQTIKITEAHTNTLEFIKNGLACDSEGLALESELHQCMKESYHLPNQWDGKFATKNVDNNYHIYANAVCLIPGDSAIMEYTLKLNHPNRIKEIGEGLCQGYKIMIQTREEIKQYENEISVADINACNRYKLICSKDGLGKEAKPYAENNCGSPEFQHKGHEYVYDCFKHEIITDKTVGSCYWDCAGGEL